MKKISTKLWLLMLALIAVMLGLLWLFQIEMLDKYYVVSQSNRIIKEGTDFAELLLDGASEAQLEDKAEQMYLKYNVSIEAYRLDGTGLFRSQYAPRMMGMNFDRKNIFEEALSGEKTVKRIYHNRFMNQMLMAGIPLREGIHITGAVLLNAPLAAVEETASILKQQLGMITIILIMVSLVLSYFFSKIFTDPIININKAARQMAEGNLSIKLEVKTLDELGMLSDTINDLSRQLQKIERLREELIANVSHEFRTPLSLIKGYAETIKDVSGNNPEKREKQLNIILEETDRLKEMVDDILNLAQIQSQYFQLDKAAFDIGGTVRTVMERFHYLQDERGVNFIADIPGTVLNVLGDESRIEQVLYNLVHNGFSHTESGGTLSISALEHGNTIKLVVADSGEGIPEKDLPHIWDRFYKGTGQSSSGNGGTGLGLAIVRSILEAHESAYGVESKAGSGTSFWFTLCKA